MTATTSVFVFVTSGTTNAKIISKTTELMKWNISPVPM